MDVYEVKCYKTFYKMFKYRKNICIQYIFGVTFVIIQYIYKINILFTIKNYLN